jgi:hypothetical protein
MLVENMSRNKCPSSFEYHMFYVLYPFVTHLLTLPRMIKEMCPNVTILILIKSPKFIPRPEKCLYWLRNLLIVHKPSGHML